MSLPVSRIWQLVAACLAFAANPVVAQLTSVPPPAAVTEVDRNSVDVVRGLVVGTFAPLSIGGKGAGALTFSIVATGADIRTSFASGIQYQWVAPTNVFPLPYNGGYRFSVVAGNSSDTFFQAVASSGVAANPVGLTSEQGSGAAITAGPAGTLKYTSRDGSVVSFSARLSSYSQPYFYARTTSIKTPSGEVTNFIYKDVIYQNCNPFCINYPAFRLQSAVSNFGYILKIGYKTNLLPFSQAPDAYDDWLSVTSARAINLAVDYCDAASDDCANLTQSWPTVSLSTVPEGAYKRLTIADPVGRTSSILYEKTSAVGQRVLAVRRASSTVDNLSFTYDSAGRVSAVNDSGSTWSYAYADNGSGLRTTTVTSPLGVVRTLVSNTAIGRVVSDADALGRTTLYRYDAQRRVDKITYPEGNWAEYVYDTRGNVTTSTMLAKPGSGLPNIVTTANFDATCSSPAKCNKPNWTKDANNNQTDYTYDSTHGGVTSVKAPAVGGIRPETRYGYTALQAFYKLSGQSIAGSGASIYLPTQTSVCRTTASCSGGADETRTAISFGPQTAGTPNNLLPVSSTTAAGDGSLSASIALTYDFVGNLLTVDGPASGAADKTRYRYNAARQREGVVSADPDGAGPLKPLAQRVTYNVDGLPTVSEIGNVNGQTDGDWAGFASFAQQTTTYDTNNRRSRDVAAVSGTTTSVQQYGYDALGRLLCSALRMDPAQWNSQSDACTPQTGAAAGPDRITRLNYDAAGQVLSQIDGFGTAIARTTQTLTYNNNGTLASLADAKGNRTGYTYDGFDRLLKTNFPTAGNGSVTSGTDYEQYGYDANGNRTSLLKRSGQTIGYAYDALNRVTTKTMPDASQTVSYTYNLIGRMGNATFPTGLGVSIGYDAFGRVNRQDDSTTDSTRPSGWDRGQRLSFYDARGNRTSFSLAGAGFNYEYDVLDRVTRITDGSGVEHARFTYDQRGRRTSITRGASPATTTYGYDAVSQLGSLEHNLDGNVIATNDIIQTFLYNKAGQITSRAVSNDSYVFTNQAAVTRPYVTNGLNQYSSAGTGASTANFSYDANGNLTSDGSVTYSYDTENRLTAASGATTASLLYDPLGRLVRVRDANVANARWFIYDGSALVAEYDGNGAMVKRYMHGPGVDEPLAWFDGSGTASANRHDMFANAQGSIIAITNGSGTTEAINRYDEFGIPQPGNVGRFGFTGQAWIPELGLSYYKARMYSPSLGRFMQTDPIGYDDGPNWYDYVGGDPVNRSDPSGMDAITDRLSNSNSKFVRDAVAAGSDPDLIIVTAERFTGPTLNFGSCAGAQQCLRDAFFGARPPPSCSLGQKCALASSQQSGLLNIGYYKGIETFGSTPGSARRGVVGTDRPGELQGYKRDLEYLATLNGIPNPNTMAYPNDFTSGPWKMFGGPTDGGIVYLGPGPAYGFSGRLGKDGDWRITIPPGLFIAPNTPAGIGEVVHYRRRF